MTSKSESVELLPCPFCGERLVIGSGGLAAHKEMQRGTCLLRSFSFPIEDNRQVTLWNTRTQKEQS